MTTRLLLVRPWMFFTAVAACLAMEMAPRLFAYRLGVPYEQVALQIPFATISTSVFAFYYAGYRALRHPLFDKNYLRWLAATPWESGLPLPLGPAALAWQDGLMVGIIAAMAVALGRSPLPQLLAFCTVYLLATIMPAAITKQYAYFTSVCLLVPFIGFCSGWTLLIVPAILLVLLQVALHKGLRTFPWPEATSTEAANKTSRQPWPFRRVNGIEPGQIGIRNALILSLLVGWWIYGLAHEPIDQAGRAAIGPVIAGGILCGITRALLYWAPFASPLSPLGRLATGRLIIPGYDKMLLAPLLIAVTALALPVATGRIPGITPSLVVALTASAVLFLTLAMPPSWRDWALTGQHHLRMRRL